MHEILPAHSDWSRWRLSVHLAQISAWRSPAGQLKDMAAHTLLLLKLESKGLLILPVRRRVSPNPMSRKSVANPESEQDLFSEQASTDFCGVLPELLPLNLFGVHAKRGTEVMDALGVLPHCRCWLIHDFWKPYLKYEALHALCNQHLLCELKFLFEQCGEIWADQLSRFLLDWKNNPLARDGLKEDAFEKAHDQYQRMAAKGRVDHPRRKRGQGRGKQNKATNLLERLEDYDLNILAFLLDRNVPFTNN